MTLVSRKLTLSLDHSAVNFMEWCAVLRYSKNSESFDAVLVTQSFHSLSRQSKSKSKNREEKTLEGLLGGFCA